MQRKPCDHRDQPGPARVGPAGLTDPEEAKAEKALPTAPPPSSTGPKAKNGKKRKFKKNFKAAAQVKHKRNDSNAKLRIKKKKTNNQ